MHLELGLLHSEAEDLLAKTQQSVSSWKPGNCVAVQLQAEELRCKIDCSLSLQRLASEWLSAELQKLNFGEEIESKMRRDKKIKEVRRKFKEKEKEMEKENGILKERINDLEMVGDFWSLEEEVWFFEDWMGLVFGFLIDFLLFIYC